MNKCSKYVHLIIDTIERIVVKVKLILKREKKRQMLQHKDNFQYKYKDCGVWIIILGSGIIYPLPYPATQTKGVTLK